VGSVTFEECQAVAGTDRHVTFTAYPGARVEVGVVTRMSGFYAFVRYGSDSGSKATMPALLTLEGPE
jgi:hypothetical protein